VPANSCVTDRFLVSQGDGDVGETIAHPTAGREHRGGEHKAQGLTEAQAEAQGPSNYRPPIYRPRFGGFGDFVTCSAVRSVGRSACFTLQHQEFDMATRIRRELQGVNFRVHPSFDEILGTLCRKRWRNR